MLKSSARPVIRLRGVRHNNLKNFDIDLPLKQLIVITGLSGSGKSSLAFDTLFAEGQRRYIETFSPYARQFFDRMDKPQADSIEGIPPAIAVEQRNSVRTTRSTVGTMTEICDYMKLLWPHSAQLHCRQCDQPVRKDSPQMIWDALFREERLKEKEVLITFNLPLSEKLSLPESLSLIAKQGFQRLLLDREPVRIEDVPQALASAHSPDAFLTVIQDRLRLAASHRSRFVEACEQAYHFGKGKLAIHEVAPAPTTILAPQRFSNHLHCASCDIEYREPSPALFSFNHPAGACSSCRGFGRMITIDYNRALPDRSKSLGAGVVKPWQSGHGLESQKDLLRACRHFEIPIDVPFEKLPRKWQSFVIEGDPDYGKDEEHEWPRAWYGVKGYFRWLESKAYKMHIRVLLSRYRSYVTCPACGGNRLQPEALLYRVDVPELRNLANGPNGSPFHATSLTLADFYQLPVRDACRFIEALTRRRPSRAHDPLALALNEVRSRLGYLDEVGLGYLTLDRPTRSLSGGETERVNLTTCLGTRLVNTLFVLDEPSVGLHPRDTERLVRILEQLRDAGNTVIVVEHESAVIRAADQVVDLGPGHGAAGGEVVFQGTFAQLTRAPRSLTGQYLGGRRNIEIPQRRPIELDPSPGEFSASRSDYSALILHDRPRPISHSSAVDWLKIAQGSKNNLKNFSVQIPLHRFVCVTGVSGSGKSTLVREILLPSLMDRLDVAATDAKASDRLSPEEKEDEDERSDSDSRESTMISGWEHLNQVVVVDQSILGKTPRSNPAVYIGAFDEIRELFAQSDIARQRGLNASAFSFNSNQGQCERCRGAGFEKIEMQFLSDIFIRCPECNGRRYRQHILKVRISPERGRVDPTPRTQREKTRFAPLSLSIADLLEATVDEALEFLAGFANSRPADRARASLKLLQDVGLGYLKLGQPINTLSGGESQRLKLVRHLAGANVLAGSQHPSIPRQGSTLFLFDEPTTGLHFDDVRVLLRVFQQLVDAGHSLLVIEHNLEVIKCSDWVIDLGPDAGDQGGQLVAQGTPEQIATCASSHTGAALRKLVGAKHDPNPPPFPKLRPAMSR